MHNTRYIVARPGALPTACRNGLRSCERYAPYAQARQFSHHWPVHPLIRSAGPAFSQEIGSLFRLVDEFSRTGFNDLFPAQQHLPKVFQPRFDVKESQSAYELRGELPGVDSSNVSIEFTDPQTLVIKGRSERDQTTEQLPEATANTNAQAIAEAPEANVEENASDSASVVSDSSYQRPSVADVDAEGNEVSTPTSSVSAAAANAETNQPGQHQAQPEESQDRYWVSERSVGEFARTFSFPSRVDQDSVSASLKDGILNVVIPKAKAPEARKISIQSA